MGLTAAAVERLIQVYAFMVKHEENDTKRWSYFDEYLKHRSIQQARNQYPQLDSIFAAKVRSGEIEKAVDVRDKMPLIAACGGKIIKDFIEVEGSF